MATVLVSENVFVFTENPFLKFFFFPPSFLLFWDVTCLTSLQ